MKNKGSILIWTMFVSLFIVSFFVVYQWSFLNFAKTSEVEGEKIEATISMEETLISLKNNPAFTIKVGKFSLKSVDFNWASFTEKLALSEATIFKVTNTWWVSSLPIIVNSGWPMIFETISYDLASAWLASVYDSWVVNSSTAWDIKLDGSKEINIIGLRSLGGISSFSLQKKMTDLVPPINDYALYQDFSTWSKFMRNEEVLNFDWESLPITYKNFRVFLNSTNYGK